MAEETVQITAVLKDQFSRQSNAITKSIAGLDKALGDLSKTLGPLASRFTVFGAALSAVGLSRLASDAEETASKFDAVFKDLADDTRDFVDNLATSVGRSRTELTGFLATLQDTFVPLGFARQEAAELSKALTELAIDVASFNNTSDAEVVRAFQSALVGNTEAVRRYGIVLSQARLEQEAIAQGFENGLQGLTEAEKAQLRFNIILQSTADAQGDAIRTQDSFQNSLKATTAAAEELGIIIGSVLNNELRPFLVSIRETIVEITEWARANKATIQAVIQLTGDILLLVAAFKALSIIRALIPVLSALGTVLSSAGSAAFIFARNILTVRSNTARTAGTLRALRGSLLALRGAFAGVGVGLFIAAITDATIAVRAAENAIDNLGDVINDQTKSFAEIQEEINNTKEELLDLATSRNPFLNLTGFTIAADQVLKELIATEQALIEQNNQVTRSATSLVRALQSQADAAEEGTQKQRDLADAASALNAILAQQGDVARNANQALTAGAEELIDLWQRGILTQRELIALSKQRTIEVQRTVQAFLQEVDAAEQLARQSATINNLFRQFGASVNQERTSTTILRELEAIDVDDRAEQLNALDASLKQLRETGAGARFDFDLGIAEAAEKDREKLQELDLQLRDIVSVLRNEAANDFFEKQAADAERETKALNGILSLREQEIEQQRLLGQLTDEEAAQQQQAAVEAGLQNELSLQQEIVAALRQKLAATSGEAAKRDVQDDLNKELTRELELRNQLQVKQQENVNADLQAANTLRDSFLTKAGALNAFVEQQQEAVNRGQTTFEEAQQKIIDKQAELQFAFEDTTEAINQTFGEGTELAERYNQQLIETNELTQQLELSSEKAFTTLDRVLQQTTGTLVNSLTNNMAGFFETIITGSEDGRQAFGDMLRDMARSFATFAAQTIAKLLIIRAISTFIPGGFAAQSVGVGVATGSGFNTGGHVPGSGPDRDSVPAVLTPGEYVIPRKRVQQYGLGVFNALRAGLIPRGLLRGFSSGTTSARGNALQTGGQATDGSVGLQQSGEGLVLPVMQADDNNLDTILSGGESAMMRFFERNNTQIKATLDSSER